MAVLVNVKDNKFLQERMRYLILSPFHTNWINYLEVGVNGDAQYLNVVQMKVYTDDFDAADVPIHNATSVTFCSNLLRNNVP